jgi:hypothetical protein
MKDDHMTWRKFQDWAILVLLGLSLGLNAYLAAKVRVLPRVAQATLAAGAMAPRLRVEDVNGRRIVLDWAGALKPTILYIFTPACVWCQRNNASLNLFVSSQKSAYRIVGLSLTDGGLKNYIDKYKIEYDAVYANPLTFNNQQSFQAVTPTTILISKDGVMENVWQGAYTGAVKRQIEEKFGIQFPTLAMSSAAND